VAGLEPGLRAGDVGVRLLGLRDAGEPQLPELAVGGGRDQAVVVLAREGLEAHAVAFEGDRFRVDHGTL